MSPKHHSLQGLVLCIALSVTQTWAGCENPHLPNDVHGYAICKNWPAYDGQTITALSQIEPDTVMKGTPDDMAMYDLKLALVSSFDGKLLARYAEKSVYSSDAMRFNGLIIDTAHYKLTPDIRAFGIRAEFNGSSKPNPFGQTVLSLFVREGSMLRPVLKQLAVESGGGEWDTHCAGEFSNTKRTLNLANSNHNGFADLIIKSVTVDTHSWEKNGECETKDNLGKTVLTTLHYNGQQYVIPQELRGF